MRVRVVASDGHVIGTMDIDELPAVGDLFHWEDHGPYQVVRRTWYLQAHGEEEKVVLEVKAG